MSIFDLLFIVLILATIVTLVVAAVMAFRGRGRRALVILLRLGVCAAVYLGIVILVSLVSPRRVLNVGDDQCWDDWCVAVSNMQRTKADASVRYVVTLRISSRSGRRAQRGRGSYVYLMDDDGRCYDPVPDRTAIPFDVLLQPLEAVNVTRVFELPADAHHPVLVMSHGGGFPGNIIIGDSESLFHKRTVVRLD
jgi:hypothetical protein